LVSERRCNGKVLYNRGVAIKLVEIPRTGFRIGNHPKGIQIKWASNSELIIRYTGNFNPRAKCSDIAGDVTVTCEVIEEDQKP
jgi:hypothetical protein